MKFRATPARVRSDLLCVALVCVALGGLTITGCSPSAGEPVNSAPNGGTGAQGGAGGSAPPPGGGTGGAMSAGAGGSGGSTAPGTGGAGGASGQGGSAGADAGASPAPAPDAAGPSAPIPGAGITDGLTQRLVSRGIGMGYYHLCVLTPEQTVRCFGDVATPADPRINPPANIKPDQIHGAHNGFCFIQPPTVAERVRCWGHNPIGFPGNGVTANTDPIQVGHGYEHGCLLNRDNTVKCWGQAGAQYQPPAGLKAKALTIAAFFNCAIKMDDTAVCWGIQPPQPPPDLKMKLLATVYHGINKLNENPGPENHACAILMDDSVRCWGQEVAGNLTPPPGLKAKDIAVATNDSCAVTLEGDVVCWGTSHYNDSPARYHPRPAGIKAKAIRSSMATYCALKEDNTLACWGDEQHDHLSFPPDLKVYAP